MRSRAAGATEVAHRNCEHFPKLSLVLPQETLDARENAFNGIGGHIHAVFQFCKLTSSVNHRFVGEVWMVVKPCIRRMTICPNNTSFFDVLFYHLAIVLRSLDYVHIFIRLKSCRF